MGRWKFRLTRDTIFLAAGLTGFLHEVFIYKGEERPSVLIVCAAMMGLPLYLRQNGK